MSNLGLYQWITTESKKAGGVDKFLGFIRSEGVKQGMKIGFRSGFRKGSLIGGIGGTVAVALVGGIYLFKKIKEDVSSDNKTAANDTQNSDEISRIVYGPFHFSVQTILDGEKINVGDEFWVAENDGDVFLIFFPDLSDNPIYLDKHYLIENTDFKDINIPEFK